jgi:hypothetical protein
MSSLTLGPKILGREPAILLQSAHAVLLVLSSFLPAKFGLDHNTVALIQILITAAVTAWVALHVKPVAPTVLSGVVIAAVNLLARFGWPLSEFQIASLLTVIAFFVTFWSRNQQTPVYDPAADLEVAPKSPR